MMERIDPAIETAALYNALESDDPAGATLWLDR